MGELDPTADPEQAGFDGGLAGDHAEPEAVGGSMQQHEIALRLGCRDKHEQPSVARELAQSLGEALLDLAGDSLAAREPEPAGELGRVPRAWELEQRERVAVTLRHDLLEHGFVERTLDVVQRAARALRSRQALEDQLGKLASTSSPMPERAAHDDRDPFGEETTGDEAEDLSRGAVEPLGVVDDADQRLLLGDVGEQRQRRQPDQKAIRRRRPAPQSEDRLERLALTDREPVQVFAATASTADGGR